MADISLNTLAGLENLKRWISSFFGLVSQLRNSKVISGKGSQAKRSPAPDANLSAAAAFQNWLLKYKLLELLGTRITRDGGPGSLPIDLKTFSQRYLALRGQLPGLFNSAKINPSEASAALAELDQIYNKFVKPYI